MKHPGRLINLAVVVVAVLAQFVVATSKRPRNDTPTRFTVRVENISNTDGQKASDGTKWPFALSPGMFVLNARKGILFAEGQTANKGLEQQAEDGNPAELVKSLENMHHSSSLHGVFNTPVGAMDPGPIGPGAAYEFTFTATPGMKLFIIQMFGQSNDLFYANDAGVELFNSQGKPIAGDITSKLVLWDAGTEVNQEPGLGLDQAPRQKSPNTGAEENGTVHRAKQSVFYTKTSELFRVTLMPESGK
jgi:hypothetical protein